MRTRDARKPSQLPRIVQVRPRLNPNRPSRQRPSMRPRDARNPSPLRRLIRSEQKPNRPDPQRPNMRTPDLRNRGLLSHRIRLRRIRRADRLHRPPIMRQWRITKACRNLSIRARLTPRTNRHLRLKKKRGLRASQRAGTPRSTTGCHSRSVILPGACVPLSGRWDAAGRVAGVIGILRQQTT